MVSWSSVPRRFLVHLPPMSRLSVVLIFFLGSLVACGDQKVPELRRLAYETVGSTPHDPFASTLGLLLHDGIYYESTGGYGKSILRRVEPDTGRILQIRDLPPTAFGEGLALRGDRLYQLEWKSGKGFLYDRESFERVGDFR